MDYIFSGDRTVRIFHAMSKKYGTVRYTTYYDPDSENWTEWVLALDYESADQQAIEDMEVMFKDDSRFIGIVAGTFGKDLDQWSTDWELRWMEFLYIGNRTVTVFHATSKSIPSLRAINYFNPDASAWVDWVLVE